MSKPLRTILFWLFVTAFFCTAPLLVLYTFGFRYNFQTNRVEHTGIISVSTTPKGAVITIDGKTARQTTPTLLKQLLPREHTITLSKDGYLPWTKTVRSEERATVFLDGVVLWADQGPTKDVSTSDLHLLNPTHTALAQLVTNGVWTEAWVEDLQKNERTLVNRFPGSDPASVSLFWSPDGEWLLFQQNDTTSVVKRDGTELTPLTEHLPHTNSRLWWDEGTPHTLVLSTQAETTMLTIPALESTPIIPTATETLISQDGSFIFTRQTPTQTFVVDLVNGSETVIAILPKGTYQFAESRSPFLLLFETRKNRLVMLDRKDHDQPILLQTEAKEATWSPVAPTLLYTDGFETHLFAADTLRDTLIDRVSRPVSSVTWHPSGTSVLLAHEDGIVAYDLHEPGQLVRTPLNNAKNVTQIAMDNKGALLFFLGTLQGDYGLYRQVTR